LYLGPGFESWQSRNFLSTFHPVQLLGLPSFLANAHQGLSLGVKHPRHEADYSPPSNAEVKNEWSCMFTPPYVFMVW